MPKSSFSSTSFEIARKWTVGTVADSFGEGVVITDPNAVIVAVNDNFTAVTGFTREESVGQTPRILKSGRHDKEFYRKFWEQLKGEGGWQGKIWNRRKNGEIYQEWLTINAIKDASGHIANYIGVFTDISKRNTSRHRIEYLATHDELTALPNRLLFSDRLRQAVLQARRSGESVAVFFIDLDNFKMINDSFGHDVGDLFLKDVSHRLSECVRSEDTVARYGGDEFVMVVRQAGKEDAEIIAERLSRAMSAPFLVSGQTLKSSANVGISLFPLDGDSEEILLKNADAAMYFAKEVKGKRTHHFFSQELKKVAAERFLLESQFREAIERGHLALLYQPQMRFDSNRLIGFEVLVRWAHPSLGEVMPDTFIPLAEKCGLLLLLGEWIAENACRQLSEWRAAGYDVPRLSINVSAELFRIGDIPAMLVRFLKTFHLDPSDIIVELAESTFDNRHDRSEQQIPALASMGIKISIDDFGTGYFSLARLQHLPISELKIAQRFVSELTGNSGARTIAKTIILMAEAFGFDVIAEGVETEEQFALLRQIGCPVGQGPLFSRPLTSEEVKARFAVRQEWILSPEPSRSRTEHPRRTSLRFPFPETFPRS